MGYYDANSGVASQYFLAYHEPLVQLKIENGLSSFPGFPGRHQHRAVCVSRVNSQYRSRNNYVLTLVCVYCVLNRPLMLLISPNLQ